jgi:hypothetical protein
MNRQAQWLEVELEENPRSTMCMFNYASVVGDAVLVSVQRGTSRRNISRRDDMQKILVYDECCKKL